MVGMLGAWLTQEQEGGMLLCAVLVGLPLLYMFGAWLAEREEAREKAQAEWAQNTGRVTLLDDWRTQPYLDDVDEQGYLKFITEHHSLCEENGRCVFDIYDSTKCPVLNPKGYAVGMRVVDLYRQSDEDAASDGHGEGKDAGGVVMSVGTRGMVVLWDGMDKWDLFYDDRGSISLRDEFVAPYSKGEGDVDE